MTNSTKNLIKRLITGACLIVAATLILYFSSNDTFIRLIAAIFACFATYEFFNVTDTMEHEVGFVVTLLLSVVLPFVNIPYYTVVLLVAFLLAVIVSVCMMTYTEKFRLAKPFSAAMLSIVVALFFVALPKIRALENGLYYLICPLLICITTDTAAYFIGRKWGTTKMLPSVSPNKTWEGALAGLAISFVISIAFCLILQFCLGVFVKWKIFFTYALFTSVVGQFGDLTASIVKRIANVKDYGIILPGHGGVLDRLDSIVFAFAFTYLFCTLGGMFLV